MTSKLEELIAKLCPNGVEYKALSDVSDMKRGMTVTKKSVNPGDIPVISGGREPAYYCDISNRNGETITVAGSGAGAGFVQYWDKPIFVCDAFSVKGVNDLTLTKFLYYVLLSKQEAIYATKKGGGVPHVHISSIKDFEIPVPPLDVQAEIVQILDTFTELTAELTARKKQYEYYRDALLTFDDNNPLHSLISRYCPNGVEYKKIGDIASVDRGGSLQKKDFCEHGIPCIHYGQIYTKYGLFASKSYTFIDSECASKQRFAHKNDIVMAVTSENIEDVCKCVAWFGEEDAAVSGHSAIIRHNQNAKYLVYYFHSSMFFLQKKKLAHGTKVIEVTPSDLLDVKIPVPPLEVQRQIVQILDRFDALCNDLTQGLPAEIEARRKQYEYYRDQLLTFKRA